MSGVCSLAGNSLRNIRSARYVTGDLSPRALSGGVVNTSLLHVFFHLRVVCGRISVAGSGQAGGKERETGDEGFIAVKNAKHTRVRDTTARLPATEVTAGLPMHTEVLLCMVLLFLLWSVTVLIHPVPPSFSACCLADRVLFLVTCARSMLELWRECMPKISRRRVVVVWADG